MVNKDELISLYIEKKYSMSQIAKVKNVSVHQISYLMNKYKIQRRSVSEAVYTRNHPSGHPFRTRRPSTIDEATLYGIGIGLYWGEGTKRNKHAVRLGNSDSELIKTFMKFLISFFDINRKDLRFGLQIFNDLDPETVLSYWINELNINREQFYKIHITPSNVTGTYTHKNPYGVVTVYYHNSRLRDIIVGMLPR